MPASYMPICISLKDCKTLVVGGGEVALRKIEMLLDYESDITVIAPDVADKVAYFADKGEIKLEKREYQSPEASNYGVVISAADDRDVNKMVHDDCVAASVPVNVVDDPPLCTFIVPATVRRDQFSIAISTDGAAPYLARFVRALLEGAFPKYWGKVTKYAHDFRKMVYRKYRNEPENMARSFERFLATDWKKVTKELNEDQIKEELEKLLED
jgi:uroporphyrin-III C-methyltransferase/precorrin-2 dehydrogenase/sirohydrochlorin ferrochelatase